MSQIAAPPLAILLAAGVGRRLGEGQPRPKVLLDFEGRSLLRRRLEALHTCGVEDVSITVGYEAEAVRRAVSKLQTPLNVCFVDNPRYEEGSLISLLAQHQALTADRPVLVMDGDVLHDSRMVRRLLDAAGENILLVDPELEAGDEPVKVCFQGERIVDFRKKPALPHDRHGESVGFFRFSARGAAELAGWCRAKLEADGALLEYEEAIRDMILSGPERFVAEDVGDLPWTEIDFPEDVVRARDVILPALQD